jgi:hypothetical protein
VQADAPCKIHYKNGHVFCFAAVLPSALPDLPFHEIFGLLRTVAIIGGLLWIVLAPAILKGYESWKRKERAR